jgi:hypothetical protein
MLVGHSRRSISRATRFWSMCTAGTSTDYKSERISSESLRLGVFARDCFVARKDAKTQRGSEIVRMLRELVG